MPKLKLQTSIGHWVDGDPFQKQNLTLQLSEKPTLISSVYDQLFTSTDLYADNPLTATTIKLGAEETIDGDTFEWVLNSSNKRVAIVIENIENSTTPGRFRSNISFKFDVPFLKPGDVISPVGSGDKKHLVRINEGPIKQGEFYIYRGVLVTEDSNDFLPVRYLIPGAKWARLFNTVEEGSRHGSTVWLNTPIVFRNRLSKLRMEYSVTGDFANSKIVWITAESKKGKAKSWINMLEVEFWKEWYKMREYALWFGKMQSNIIGETGRTVITGAGLLEQLEDATREYYTVLTPKLLEDFLMGVFFGRVKPGKVGTLYAYTGWAGMIEISRALDELVAKNNIFIVGGNFNPTEKVKSEYHSNAYSYGYQFVRYKMKNGITLEVVHNPLYDDPNLSAPDPINGYPEMSYRITFLDFGSESTGGRNIRRIKRKNGDSFVHIDGLWTPAGPNKGSAASSLDGYEVHIKTEEGIMVEDPTRCGELIFTSAI